MTQDFDENHCYNCMYFVYDYDTDASDCKKAEFMNEWEFEKHFINDESGCPYFEEDDEEDDETIREYLDSLEDE